MNIKDHARRKPRVHSWATLSNEQISKILSLSERDPLVHDIRDVVLIATGTGIRAGELRDLQWTDVDLSRRELTIRSNSGSIRKVPLGDETLGVFEARRARQPELELVLGVSPRRVIERVSRKLAVLSKSIGSGVFRCISCAGHSLHASSTLAQTSGPSWASWGGLCPVQ